MLHTPFIKILKYKTLIFSKRTFNLKADDFVWVSLVVGLKMFWSKKSKKK